MVIVLFPLQKGQRLIEAIYPSWLLCTPPTELFPGPGGQAPRGADRRPPPWTLPVLALFCLSSQSWQRETGRQGSGLSVQERAGEG